jgi:hypothetical protein
MVKGENMVRDVVKITILLWRLLWNAKGKFIATELMV